MRGDCANCNCSQICYTKAKSCVPVDIDAVLANYTDEEKEIMRAAAYVEGTYYMQHTRLQEVADFAEAMHYKKIGMAFCIGISEEARYFARYLSKKFEVCSVCCKNCGIPKEKLGLTRVRPDAPVESMCNPKEQARFLSGEGCDLFVVAGLCVGHDSIFMANCDGPVTALVVKDRVLANNPMGAVYSGYWRKKLGIDD